MLETRDENRSRILVQNNGNLLFCIRIFISLAPAKIRNYQNGFLIGLNGYSGTANQMNSDVLDST